MWMAKWENKALSEAIFASYGLLFFGDIWLLNHVVWKENLNSICSGFFLRINNLGVDLCRCHLFVTKHFADSIDICSTGELQGGIGMAETVESDRLRKEKQTEED